MIHALGMFFGPLAFSLPPNSTDTYGRILWDVVGRCARGGGGFLSPNIPLGP